MGAILLVPIHLDALCLKTDLSVADAKAEFTRLPFWDGAREVNPDVANISEALLSRPFHDRGLQLRAGIHLHWALPDALTRGANKAARNGAGGKLVFPAVPNRWLVTRGRKSGAGKPVVEQQWVVESDYLHPIAAEAVPGGIPVPFPADPAKENYQPYRYLGRKRPFNAQWAEDASAESLARSGYRLTAVGYEPASRTVLGGYSEPAFAALYPNCLSVFGLHDPLLPSVLAGMQYDLIGWYGDPRQDCLRAGDLQDAMDKINEAYLKAGKTRTTAEVKREAIEQLYKWKLPADGEVPDRTVCYARLVFDAEPSSAAMKEKAVTVAVGNTPTEALSAYLAGTTPNSPLLEDRLEALHLSSKLEGKELDVGLKFKEARHEKGFTAVPCGTLWGVREQTAALPRPAGDDASDETLPRELAHLLNRLNLRQQECDRAAHELEAMQRQLFADWYKYMLCVYPPDDSRDNYPDVDEVRHFIQKNGLRPIKRQQAKLSALDFECRQSQSDLSNAIVAFNRRANKSYVVQPRSAPRFWRPNEPALLVVDDAVEPTERHNQDGRLHPEGLLECQAMAASNEAIEKLIQPIRAEMDKAAPAQGKERIGFDNWTNQPWNPFALEWRVEFFPRQKQNNLNPEDRDYHADFITANYRLGQDADLELQPGQEAIEKAASVYAGGSLLTPQAKLQLQEQLRKFLDNLHEERVKNDPVLAELQEVSRTLEESGFHAMAQSLNGFNEALLMRKQTLQLPVADPFGFDDTWPFTDSVRRAIGNRNRTAPQPHNDFNPIRAGVLKILELRLVDTFGRTQTLKPRDNRIFTAEAMRAPGNPHLISMPPRLQQPARLNFRWLSADRGDAADTDEPEMNAHPATTPVCGWLIQNNLDGSLMVYDNAGRPLGSINKRCRWSLAPGAPEIAAAKIENVHLRTLVNHLIGQGKDDPLHPENTYFKDFFGALESALENIDPENFAQHEATALLVGRPIAVVRATLDLELCGLPAINEDWNVFRLDLERYLRSEETLGDRPAPRDTDAFTRVRFPIRLGDDRQLNDGLIGYWKEDWTGGGSGYSYENDRFYVHACDTARVLKTDLAAVPIAAAQKTALAALLQNSEGVVTKHCLLARFADAERIWQMLLDQNIIAELKRDARIRYAACESGLSQTVDDPAQKLTMLVDPRGAVHAISGVLPVKAIRIPPDQFAEALQRLAITFFSAPVVTSQGKINLPLPAEPGFVWSWLSKSGGEWATSDIGAVNVQATWNGPQEIDEGWLRLSKAPRK
jgi:hypothetical protein